MKRNLRALTALLLLVVSGTAMASPGGDKILKEIDALKRPPFDSSKRNDNAYRESYMAMMAEFTKKRNALILDLYKEDPTHARTASLMEERWMMFESGNIGDGNDYAKRVLADIDQILVTNPPPAVREAGMFAKASTKMNSMGDAGGDVLAIVDEFVKAFPKSERAPTLLISATYSTSDREVRKKLYHRIVDEYPNYRMIAMVKGALRQSDEMGKPFALKFEDAITGSKIDLSSMKGKVVMVDFWATWCGPCVAEMPHVLELYKKYHDKGFEIVGVSLDNSQKEGGLSSLKEYVEKNKIPWPQYYQGKGWDGEFSTAWGIMSIPCTFFVDKKGNFVSVSPRDLEAEIKRLLGS